VTETTIRGAHGTATFELIPPYLAEMTRRSGAGGKKKNRRLSVARSRRLKAASSDTPMPALTAAAGVTLYGENSGPIWQPQSTAAASACCLLQRLIIMRGRGYRHIISLSAIPQCRLDRVHTKNRLPDDRTPPSVGLKFCRWLDTVMMHAPRRRRHTVPGGFAGLEIVDWASASVPTSRRRHIEWWSRRIRLCPGHKISKTTHANRTMSIQSRCVR